MLKKIIFVLFFLTLLCFALGYETNFDDLKFWKNWRVSTGGTNSVLTKTQLGGEPGDSLRQPDRIVVVKIASSTFNPPVITISSGTVVQWINEDAIRHRIASNPCPMHSELPELTSLELRQGDIYNFTFVKTGTFGYHDHLHPEILGKIIVE